MNHEPDRSYSGNEQKSVDIRSYGDIKTSMLKFQMRGIPTRGDDD